MLLEDHELEPASVLRGHMSPETAFVVDDYPCGFGRRCKIRYWLDVPTRGSAAGKVRLMSQTHPQATAERWNKPKATTCVTWAVMIRDVRGRVTWWPVEKWGPEPWMDLLMCVRGVYDQLNEQERAAYDQLLETSRSGRYREQWQRVEQAYELVGAGVICDDLLSEHRIRIDERTHQVLAAAWALGLELEG